MLGNRQATRRNGGRNSVSHGRMRGNGATHEKTKRTRPPARDCLLVFMPREMQYKNHITINLQCCYVSGRGEQEGSKRGARNRGLPSSITAGRGAYLARPARGGTEGEGRAEGEALRLTGQNQVEGEQNQYSDYRTKYRTSMLI
jgi:hypothetical protein